MDVVQVIGIGLAAFVGAIVVAILGWADGGGPFDFRKFLPSIIRAFVGAVGIAYAFNYTDIGPLSYLLALLTGAGWDAGANKVAGIVALKWGKKETPTA